MTGLVEAVAFLTRIPVRTGVREAAGLARSVPWFPVVGGLIGASIGGVYAAAALVLSALPSAAVAVAFSVLLTGALHEDGLADTADAFGAGRDREETLRILADPRVGAYGAVAIAVALLLRASTIAALSPRTAVAALIAAGALGRGTAVGLLVAVPPATEDGLGAGYGRFVSRGRAAAGIAVGAIMAAAGLGVWAGAAAAPAVVAGLGMRVLARRRIGGITGDVLGAAEQLAEIGVLLVVLTLARVVDVTWWV